VEKPAEPDAFALSVLANPSHAVIPVPRADQRQPVAGPNPAVDGVVRWRIVDLIQWVWEEFRLSISKQTMSRELRAMGLRKLSARPRHHAQDEDAADAFKKTSSRSWRRSRRARPQASP
jgi:hypothetical protein